MVGRLIVEGLLDRNSGNVYRRCLGLESYLHKLKKGLLEGNGSWWNLQSEFELLNVSW